MATSPGTGEGLFVLGAGAGVVMVAGAVTAGRLGIVHWGVGLLGGCYVASALVGGVTPDWWSPAFAVALLASSELAAWSIDSRRRGRDDLAVHVIRLRTVVLMGAAALVLALITQVAGLVGGGGDVVPALAVGALLASVAGFCGLLLAFRRSS